MRSTLPVVITAAETRLLALELRKSGMTYQQIADEIGISVSGAFKHVSKALATFRAKAAEEAETVAALEAERLDSLHQALWPKAIQGDMPAVDRVLKIMERRAKLYGLDAPTKLAATTPGGEEEAQRGVIIVPATAGSVEEWMEQYAPKD